MSTDRQRFIGPWGNGTHGEKYARPTGYGALDRLGEVLQAATGDMATCTVEISTHEVQWLGQALRRVAAGEDARHVFGQNKVGHRRADRLRKHTIAFAYYSTFAELLAAGKLSDHEARRQAVERAQRQYTDVELSAETVEKYARAHRGAILDFLEWRHGIGKGPSVAPLRAFLDKHSRKGSWSD